MKDYTTQLTDVKWLAKKKKVLARAMFKCQVCGCEGKPLDVHHLYYIKGRKPWQYPYTALKAMCRECHSKWHDTYEIAILEHTRRKRSVFKPPKKSTKHKGPKYFKWSEHNKAKQKKKSLGELQSKEPKYKTRDNECI